MIINEKNYPNWIKDLIVDIAYTGLNNTELSKKYNKTRSTVSKYRNDENVQQEVDKLKQEFIDQYRSKLYSLISDSYKTIQEIIKTGDTDSTRLKAAERILKETNIFREETKKIEHSGSIATPIINITTEVEDAE